MSYEYVKGKLEAIEKVSVDSGRVLTKLLLADAITDQGKKISRMEVEFKGIVLPDSIGNEIVYHKTHYNISEKGITPVRPNIKDNILKRIYEGEIA